MPIEVEYPAFENNCKTVILLFMNEDPNLIINIAFSVA